MEIDFLPFRLVAAFLVCCTAMGAPWPGSEEGSNALAGEGHSEFRVTDEDRAYWAFQPLRADAPKSLDAIIEEEMSRKGLSKNPPADPATLIRRAYFDLIGLPPAFEEVRAFVNDSNSDMDAFRKLIDRLLAMPEYGERWGRHWLDVVRYAQTNGYERDDEKPESWRYRDYVIDSFNEDKAYDRFILEQLAGDELPDGGDAGIIATGFYRLGVYDDEPDDKRAAEFDGLDDMLKTTTETFLGLTVGCARCHDHMFDPLSQRDYYEMLAFFRNILPNSKENLREIAGGRAMSVAEHGPEPKETYLLVRGSAGRPADKVMPRFPEVLGGESPPAQATKASPGLRLALARWIARKDNPLTARVMANRVWQYHFGKGVIATPNDFGKAGHPPANAALVDRLASEFIKGDWSVKHLHRAIMLSNAFRRSSTPNEKNDAIDPGNDYVWRQNIRRSEAEVIRDSILKVAGSLNRRRGGDRGFYPAIDGEVVAGASKPGRGWSWSPEEEQNRRSVYVFVKRTMVYPFFEIFDYTNTVGSLGARPTTTVAPQALLLLNSEFVADCSQTIADRVRNEPDQIGAAFRAVLSRDPSPDEREMAERYLTRVAKKQEQLRDQLQFIPDYPTALFNDYQKVLPPDRYLRGPRQNWSYFKGRWTGGYEGIVNSEPDYSPFALLDKPGKIFSTSGLLQLSPATTRASILLRATIHEINRQEFDGYECVIDQTTGTASIRKHEDGKLTILSESKINAAARAPLRFTAKCEGSNVSFELSGTKLTIEDPAALTAQGKLGIIARGGPVTLSQWNITADGVTLEPVPEQHSADPSARALAEFCSLLLNLNEFIYVD
jgi:hypothetical protein